MKISPIEGMKLAGKLDIQNFATNGTCYVVIDSEFD